MEKEEENKREELFNFDIDSIVGDDNENLITVDESIEEKKTKKPADNEGQTGTKSTIDKELEDFIDVDLDNTSTEDNEGQTGTPTGAKSGDEVDEGTGGTGSSSADTSSSSDAYNLFANVLHDGGVLPNLDMEEFDGTKEGLVNAMIDEITAGIDEFRDSLPMGVRDFIDAHKLGVPMEKYLQVRQEEIAYSSITDEQLAEDESLQERVVEDYLSRHSKFSHKEIKEFINYQKDSEVLLEKSKEAKGKLVDGDKKVAKKMREDAVAQEKANDIAYDQQLKDIKKSLNATKEIIPGYTLNKKNRETLYKSLTEPAGYIENQPASTVQMKRHEDPIKFETTLHYLVQMGLFDGKWDKVLAKADSKSAAKLKDNLSKNDTFTTKQSKNKVAQKSAEKDELMSSITRTFSGTLNK